MAGPLLLEGGWRACYCRTAGRVGVSTSTPSPYTGGEGDTQRPFPACKGSDTKREVRDEGKGRRLQCVDATATAGAPAMRPPMTVPTYPTLADTVGETPLIRLQRLPGATSNVILGKMEGNNPAGSVKDRPALSMIVEAERRGEIRPGDTLIEPTSGNTGIALAMVAAMRGYRMILIMPENLSVERRVSMTAYGAQLVLTSKAGGMEGARDLAEQMVREGKGRMLDQFANPDNPLSHYRGTGPELWRQTEGRITHFVSAMGTTGTIMGVSRYLKERNPSIRIVGAQPAEGASIPGIRKWPEAYLPRIFDAARVDRTESVTQQEAEDMTRRLAAEEGIFAGISSGGACVVALRVAQEVENATIVFVVCDRGDRYLSTGVFPV
jgi:S-sulfo-L-cysteine synthase (O-acetyl-L-serine-dependent)